MRLFAVLGFLLVSVSAHAQQTITLPKSLVADAFKKADCDVEIDEVIKALEFAGDLTAGLKLVEVPCWRAAYNFGSILFMVNPKDPSKARLLRFRTLGENNKLVDTYQLSSPSYDQKTKKLGSAHKGRGAGDCGSVGEWRWYGNDFVLTRYWNKDDCDGEPFFDEDPTDKYLVYPPKQQQKKK
jgi:hypothetical protein